MNDIPNQNEVTRNVDTGNTSSNAGPFIARVIEHLDSLYLGGLRVELLKTSEAGNVGESLGQTVEVFYASPFYGTTNSQTGPAKNDDYASTQKSYGFWAIPPDPDTLVLVTFVEGSRDFGYWFACVPERGMTFMLPGGQPATEQLSGDVPTALKGKKLPTGEYNKAITKPQTNNVIKYKRPINTEFVDALTEQGLLEDEIRGITTTSAQRETPSAVLGISSPGPLDKRGGKPTAPVGLKESKANIPVSRLGSSSIVIDDGDDKLIRKGSPTDTPYEYINKEASEKGGDVTKPHNELIRLRTRTGAQILMHTSEDLIYINNSKGSCWIEMSSNGKLDVYAEDSISFHSEADINMQAGRDINLHAANNINLTSNQNTYHSVGANYELKVDGEGKISVSGNIDVKTTSTIKVQADSNVEMTAGVNTNITSLADMHINSAVNTNITSLADTHINSAVDTKITSSNKTHINSAIAHQETSAAIHMNGPEAEISDIADIAETPTEAESAKIPTRVPEHEPWEGHENWNPEAVTVDKQ